MGVIEPMAMVSALPSGGLDVGSSMLVGVLLLSTLVVAALGIWSAVPRRRKAPALRLAHPLPLSHQV